MQVGQSHKRILWEYYNIPSCTSRYDVPSSNRIKIPWMFKVGVGLTRNAERQIGAQTDRDSLISPEVFWHAIKSNL